MNTFNSLPASRLLITFVNSLHAGCFCAFCRMPIFFLQNQLFEKFIQVWIKPSLQNIPEDNSIAYMYMHIRARMETKSKSIMRNVNCLALWWYSWNIFFDLPEMYRRNRYHVVGAKCHVIMFLSNPFFASILCELFTCCVFCEFCRMPFFIFKITFIEKLSQENHQCQTVFKNQNQFAKDIRSQ